MFQNSNKMKIVIIHLQLIEFRAIIIKKILINRLMNYNLNIKRIMVKKFIMNRNKELFMLKVKIVKSLIKVITNSKEVYKFKLF